MNPYTVLQYEFWPDSAGAGEWRGGMGTVYCWRVDTDGIEFANFGGGNRPEIAPYGLAGGGAAPPHQLYLTQGDTRSTVDTESFYRGNTGDVFEIFQSGGGGYGNAFHRDPAQVLADVENGLVSHAAAADQYGVVIDPLRGAIDERATAARRAGR